MAGNIAYITLGGYINDQPGIITSLTFDIPEESPWEIGIKENGKPLDVKDIRQVPHMIKVTGFNFTPIHKSDLSTLPSVSRMSVMLPI